MQVYSCGQEDLITAIISGDRKAFTALYRLYAGDLYNYLYLFLKSKELSEDIVQDVFVKIWEKRMSLAEIVSFRAYLYRMVKNRIIDELRKKKMEEKLSFSLHADINNNSTLSDEKIINNQYYELMLTAISQLPEKRRRIVELKVKEDLSLDEIAATMSISKNVVKKQLYAGLRFVKERLSTEVEFSYLLLLFFSLTAY